MLHIIHTDNKTSNKGIVPKTIVGKFDKDPGYFIVSVFLFTFHSTIEVDLLTSIFGRQLHH